MLTEKDYCDYDAAEKLWELGYPDNNWIQLYEAAKWLREGKKIDVLVYLDDIKGYYYYIRVWNGTWEMAIKHNQLGLKGIVYNDS